jgi:peptidoglycan/xylan/chitin deacetylase (PgdA/CDA1 family)
MNKSVILLYHGVTDQTSIGIENISGKHICAKEFNMQMKYLSENKHAVPLRDIKNKRGSVAITFDDTFKNVRDVALPILKKYNIPATFFITTGFINTNRMFWVDVLEHCINFNKRQLAFQDKIYNTETDNDKKTTLMGIKSILKTLSPIERDKCLYSIIQQTKWKNELLSKNYDMMDWGDIRQLDDLPQYEVGGHTVNHEILAYLSEKKLTFEITKCISDLQDQLSRKITSFSYPEGQSDHYNDKVINVLKQSGIDMCPSAISGFVRNQDDNFNLRRIMVGFNNQKFPFKEYYA